MLIGGGSLLGSLVPAPLAPGMSDLMAMHEDQVAIAWDFWGVLAGVYSGMEHVHPGQERLFEQESD